MNILGRLLLTILMIIFVSQSDASEKDDQIKHIVLIGIDGMMGNSVMKTPTPVIDDLIEKGVFTERGKCILPSSSGPNWASLLMGCGPEIHSVKSNDWERADIRKKSFCGGKKGETVPTIFKILRKNMPDANLACFIDWHGIERYIENKVPTILADTKGELMTTKVAVDYIKKYKPFFTFIHLDNVDHAGHAHGYGTPDYLKEVSKTDHLIGEITGACKSSGMMENTLFIVMSDHGGIKKGHGGDSDDEMNIPIIFSGAGIKKGAEIGSRFMIYDIPSTILYILGIEQPDCWQGNAHKNIKK